MTDVAGIEKFNTNYRLETANERFSRWRVVLKWILDTCCVDMNWAELAQGSVKMLRLCDHRDRPLVSATGFF
jgi:hypothetical protein